jgi:hypothetical protein
VSRDANHQENSPEGARDGSPRRKPEVSGATYDSPEGATDGSPRRKPGVSGSTYDSPEAARDGSPRRKPGVSGATYDSPEGARDGSPTRKPGVSGATYDSPEGARDGSPRRKPGVSGATYDSPEGATEHWRPNYWVVLSPLRGWMSARFPSPGLRLGLQSGAPPGLSGRSTVNTVTYMPLAPDRVLIVSGSLSAIADVVPCFSAA